MDIATLVGLVGGSILIVWSIASGGSLLDFVNFPSVLITVGGTFAATMINFPFARIRRALSAVRTVFRTRPLEPHRMIEQIVQYATKARREGLLSLEDDAQASEDPFLQKGLQLVVDGADPELVRGILEIDISYQEERHRDGQHFFEQMAALSPAFGLIGTLIGLIQMLKKLDDPSSIGAGMAVALLTTLYGALMANFLFIPMAGKLKARSQEERLTKEILLEGILSIQAGDNPKIIAEKLRAFLPPARADQKAAGAPAGQAAEVSE